MHTVRHILQIKGDYIWTITPQESVYEALRLMADKDVGALVVMQGDRMVGMISEREYARKIILQGKSSRETHVSEIMTEVRWVVHPDETVEECMELMTMHKVRYLPVMEGEDLLGVVSIGDVVRDIIYRQRETIKSLEDKVINTH